VVSTIARAMTLSERNTKTSGVVINHRTKLLY